MDKEPWVFKDKQHTSLEAFNKAFKEAQPQMKKDFEELMNQEHPLAKLFTSRQ